MQTYRDLNCWKEARELRRIIMEVAATFANEEKFRLADQVIRSSRGIGNAIAEGHGRYHYQENIQYCRMARGSLEETFDHLIIAYDCQYITDEGLKEFEERYKRLLALTMVILPI